MISLLTGRVGLIAGGVLAVLALVATIYWMGGRDARRDAGELRDEITTDRRMDDAGSSVDSNDDDGILEWLRRYGE